MKNRTLIIFLASLMSFIAYSATDFYVSQSNGLGDWNTPSDWSGNSNPPNPLSNNSDVTINGTDSIVLNGSLTVGNVTNLLINGKLNITASLIVNNNLTIIVNSGGVLYVGGSADINNNTNIIINEGGKIIIGGSTAVNNNTTFAVSGGGVFNVGGDVSFGNNSIGVINGTMNVGNNFSMGSNYLLTGTGALRIGGLSCSYWTGLGTCVDASTPLPVKFVAFSGLFAKDMVFLKWTTASELNNSYFDIERSLDGTNFFSIGKVGGSGTSNKINNYKFTDLNPIETGAYYRLKQVDFDGKFDYSSILFAKDTDVKDLELGARLYPNPDHESENLYLSGLSHVEKIFLFKLNGISSTPLSFTEENGIYTIYLDGVTKGLYFIDVLTPDLEFKRRVIIE